MTASKGGLTHPVIMKLTWRQFGVYLDAFTFWQREQSDDGKLDNQSDDMNAKKRNPEWKSAVQRQKTKTAREVAKHKAFALSNPTGGVQKDLLKAE